VFCESYKRLSLVIYIHGLCIVNNLDQIFLQYGRNYMNLVDACNDSLIDVHPLCNTNIAYKTWSLSQLWFLNDSIGNTSGMNNYFFWF